MDMEEDEEVIFTTTTGNVDYEEKLNLAYTTYLLRQKETRPMVEKRKRDYKEQTRVFKSKRDTKKDLSRLFDLDDTLVIITSFCPLESIISLFLSCTSIQNNLRRIYEGNGAPTTVTVSSPSQFVYLATLEEEEEEEKPNIVSLIWRALTTIRMDCIKPPRFHIMRERKPFPYNKEVLKKARHSQELTPPKLKQLVFDVESCHGLCLCFRTYNLSNLDIVVYYIETPYESLRQKCYTSLKSYLLKHHNRYTARWKSLCLIDPLCEEEEVLIRY